MAGLIQRSCSAPSAPRVSMRTSCLVPKCGFARAESGMCIHFRLIKTLFCDQTPLIDRAKARLISLIQRFTRGDSPRSFSFCLLTKTIEGSNCTRGAMSPLVMQTCSLARRAPACVCVCVAAQHHHGGEEMQPYYVAFAVCSVTWALAGAG